MSSLVRRSLAPVVLGLALGSAVAAPAWAGSFSWNNPAGGAATIAGNWNPVGVPGAADDATIGLAGSYPIGWTFPADTLQSLTLVNCSPSFSIASRLGVRFHPLLENNCFMTITGGRLNGPSWSMIENSSSASLTVTGPFAQAWAMLPSVTSVFGAVGGTASLNILTGGAFMSAGEISLAPYAGQTLTASVRETTLVGPSTLGTTTAGIAGQGWIAVGDYGQATLALGIGGLLAPAGALFLGRHPGGSGTVQVLTDLGVPSRIEARGTTYIGANDEAGTAGGAGLLEIRLGRVSLLGPCVVGDPDDPAPADPDLPKSRLHMQVGRLVLANGLTTPVSGSGRLELRGGDTHITGGAVSLHQARTFEVGFSGGYEPRLWLENGATTDLWPPDAAHPALGVGRGGVGTLRLTGAGTALAIHGALVMGDSTGGNGLLVADTSATLTVQGRASIGGSGRATLMVRSTSGVATFQDSVDVGLPGTPGGGTLRADSLATVHLLAHTTVGGANGQLVCFEGAQMDIAGLTLGPGYGVLNVGGGGHVTVNDRLDATGQGVILVDNGGLLSVTSPTHAAMFGVDSPLAANTFISVNNGGVAQFTGELDEFGELDLMPFDTIGLLSAPDGSRTAPRWRQMSASRVALGPVIGGRLECPLTRLRGSGHIIATGTIAGRLHLDSGTAAMQVSYDDFYYQGHGVVGDSTRSDGFISIGTTTVGKDTLKVLDSDGGDLGKMTLAGGMLQLPKTGHLKSGFLLGGYGTVQGSLEVRDSAWVSFHGQVSGDVALAGTLDLGPAVAALVIGSFHPATTGRTTFKVGHLSQDVVVVLGAAALNGTLDIRSVQGDLPAVGDTFAVLTGAISGTFASVTFNGRPAAGVARVLYRAGDVRVAIIGAVTGVDDGPLAGPASPATLRFCGIGGPRDAAVALDLPTAAGVRITLYDVSGREVRTLADGELPAGHHHFALARAVSGSGIYFARAEIRGAAGTRVLTTRAVVLR